MDRNTDNAYVAKFYCDRRKKRAKRAVVVICVAVVLLIALFFYILSSISPIIVDYSQSKVKSASNHAINDALLEVIAGKYDYNDFVRMEKSQNGQITAVNANVFLLNDIARVTAEKIVRNLDKTVQSIDIPIGNLTDWAVFAGLGPNIKVTLMPLDTVNCEFLTEFESAGINQTRHKIYLKVTTHIDLIIPTYKTTIDSSNTILLAECVIVGNVPESYWIFGK